MIDAVRPEADFLRQNAALLNNTMPRADVLLFLPFRQWTERTECREGQIASELLRANIQFQVVTEDDGILSSRAAQKELKRDESAQILLIQPASTSLPGVQAPIDRFQQDGGQVVYDGPGWLSNLQQQLKEPSLRLEAPATMRAVVRDQPHKTIVHLYNLNLNRVSSYQDYLTPALDIKLTVRAPFGPVRSVRVLTADRRGTTGTLKYSVDRQNRESIITVTVPRVEVSSMIVIE
jgi:hypothetical protein